MSITESFMHWSQRLLGRYLQIHSLRYTIGFVSGGVHKRIDENRELLELLLREAPDFMERNFWVEGWLREHDDFFVAIERAVPVARGRYLGAAQRANGRFPRPWPGHSPAK